MKGLDFGQTMQFYPRFYRSNAKRQWYLRAKHISSVSMQLQPVRLSSVDSTFHVVKAPNR